MSACAEMIESKSSSGCRSGIAMVFNREYLVGWNCHKLSGNLWNIFLGMFYSTKLALLYQRMTR